MDIIDRRIRYHKIAEELEDKGHARRTGLYKRSIKTIDDFEEELISRRKEQQRG